MSDLVEHPNHYTQAAGRIEPIDFCRLFPFCFGNFCKYVLRAPYKGHEAEDLLKAARYLDWAREDLPRFEGRMKSLGHLAQCFNNQWLNAVFSGTDFDANFTRVAAQLRAYAGGVDKAMIRPDRHAVKLTGVLGTSAP